MIVIFRLLPIHPSLTEKEEKLLFVKLLENISSSRPWPDVVKISPFFACLFVCCLLLLLLLNLVCSSVHIFILKQSYFCFYFLFQLGMEIQGTTWQLQRALGVGTLLFIIIIYYHHWYYYLLWLSFYIGEIPSNSRVELREKRTRTRTRKGKMTIAHCMHL